MSGLCAMIASACLVAAAPAIAQVGLDVRAGRALFERTWVPAPSSTQASDGLGPLFNARACATCHAGGGGARLVSEADGAQRLQGTAVRLGTRDGAPDPYYGLQLQTGAVPGLVPEAVVTVWPSLTIDLKGPPLAPGVAAGVRVAPPLWGSADLERVSDDEILSRADPDDSDSDGISGRANRLGNGQIGRYGWKAGHATLQDVVAHAFLIDLGLSSPLRPFPYGDCTDAEAACRQAPHGESALSDGREVSSRVLHLIASYLATLKRRQAPSHDDGQRIFQASGCAKCHVPDLKARDGSTVRAFSDLLLHDMGDELDDSVGEPGVRSREWRTAPLKNSYPQGAARRYLHDGSAGDVAAAIARHGGEAAASRRAFWALSTNDKARLIGFVNGLE